MMRAPKLPSYNVEFPPLERRFLDRREISLQAQRLAQEKRQFARRQSPQETANTTLHGNAGRNK